jgi:hypothetical protein
MRRRRERVSWCRRCVNDRARPRRPVRAARGFLLDQSRQRARTHGRIERRATRRPRASRAGVWLVATRRRRPVPVPVELGRRCGACGRSTDAGPLPGGGPRDREPQTARPSNRSRSLCHTRSIRAVAYFYPATRGVPRLLLIHAWSRSLRRSAAPKSAPRYGRASRAARRPDRVVEPPQASPGPSTPTAHSLGGAVGYARATARMPRLGARTRFEAFRCSGARIRSGLGGPLGPGLATARLANRRDSTRDSRLHC